MSAHTKRSATHANRHGAVIIYLTVMMGVFCAMCSLAADYGHVQFVKSQLQQGADAAARHGAMGLANTLFGDSAAVPNAVAAALDCSVDGSALVLNTTTDVQIGVWDTTRHTFTANTDATVCNAVRVQAHHNAARGNPVQLVWARMLGQKTCDVNATAIAMLTAAPSITYTIPATSNPFLAGMPEGTEASPNNPHKNPDFAGNAKAPRQSPVIADGVGVVPGAVMTFDGINGSAYNDIKSPTRVSADGTSESNPNGDVGGNSTATYMGDEHGIANMGIGDQGQHSGAPLNSIVGVFLDDNQPDKTDAPKSLDFTSPQSRDFQNLAPKLKQIFFIGDGRRDNGEVQTFSVPMGATRLYIATWDRYEWNNNVGSFSVTLHGGIGTITMVQ